MDGILIEQRQRAEIATQIGPLDRLATQTEQAMQHGDVALSTAQAVRQSLNDKILTLIALDQGYGRTKGRSRPRRRRNPVGLSMTKSAPLILILLAGVSLAACSKRKEGADADAKPIASVQTAVVSGGVLG